MLACPRDYSACHCRLHISLGYGVPPPSQLCSKDFALTTCATLGSHRQHQPVLPVRPRHESVLENNRYRFYCDRTVLTDRTLPSNRPDIVFVNKTQKRTFRLTSLSQIPTTSKKQFIRSWRSTRYGPGS